MKKYVIYLQDVSNFRLLVSFELSFVYCDIYNYKKIMCVTNSFSK